MKNKTFIVISLMILMFSIHAEDNQNTQILSNSVVNNGIVIIDGKYIPPPYTIKAEKYFQNGQAAIKIQVNDIVLRDSKLPRTKPLSVVTQDITLPSNINNETSFYDPVFKNYLSYKTQFILQNISVEKQQKELYKLYESLPNLKVLEKSGDFIKIETGGKKINCYIRPLERKSLSADEMQLELLRYCNRLVESLSANSIFATCDGLGEITMAGSMDNFLRLKQRNKTLLPKQHAGTTFNLFVPSNELDKRLDKLLKKDVPKVSSIKSPSTEEKNKTTATLNSESEKNK